MVFGVALDSEVVPKSQNVSKQLQSPFCDCNWKWFCSCDLIQPLIRYFVATGSQQLFSTGFCENCSVFSDHLLTHPMFHSCTTIHFSPMSHTAWFWLLVSFSISFSRWYHSLQLLWSPVLFFSWCLPDRQALILILSHLSILFPLLLILSVFPSFINRFLLVSISFAYRWRLLLCALTWRLLAHVHFKFQTGSHLHSALYKRSRFNSI